MTKYIFICCLTFLCLESFTQGSIKIGEWDSHHPYQRISHVETSPEKVYYATDQSIVVIDKEDSSYDFLTKVEGLSETGITNMLYDQTNNQLIIAYDNAVFDVVGERDIVKIADIRNQSDIQGDKTVSDMYIQNGQFLYLATGFGLVQFDLNTLEFGFTMNISRKVLAVDGEGSNLIIALEDGVYTLDLNGTNAPGFFNEWTKQEIGLPSNYAAVDVLARDNKYYISTDTVIYVSENANNYNPLFTVTENDYSTRFIKETSEGWMLGIRRTSNLSQLIFFDAADNVVDRLTDCTRRLRDAEIDDQGRIYLADDWQTIRYLDDVSGSCNIYDINSPEDAIASDIAVGDGTVYVASGGVSDNFQSLPNGFSGFYVNKDNRWTNFNGQTSDFMQGITKIYRTAVSSSGDEVYFGSFGQGVIRYNTELGAPDTLYDETNSSLQFQIGNPRVRITALTFDDDDNLWVGNYAAERPLSVLSAEGDWFSYELISPDNQINDIVIDDSGLAWVVIKGTVSGVLVYDNNQTLADFTDDVQRFITSNNSELPSVEVLSAAVDNSGSVWIGTAQGAVVFECGTSAIEDDCRGNKRKVLQDSIVGFLLETEEVLSIAVDGADRKWFGTRNGIFVQSANGEEQIVKYDEGNSPLFDNTVVDMTFDPESGIMYIATDKGLQSIRTETTGASRRHSFDVYAFPNPVTPSYQGPIAIKGLANNAEVRITDIDGRLVYQTDALGGQAIWDGFDLNGQVVAGGVYLVFSSSSDFIDNPDSFVTKIMMIR